MPGSKGPKPRSPRRHWPISEKRHIVELALRKGVSSRSIAREHDINPTSLCQWKALYRAGKLEAQPPRAPRVRVRASSAPLVPVAIAPDVEAPQRDWSIVQVTLRSGASLRIETGALDAGVVCALVAQLQR